MQSWSRVASEIDPALSAEEFEHYALRNDNADHILELIDGEMFIVPSNPFASKISALISYIIVDHIRKHGIGGHVTGEAGGYRVGGDRYAPDVAFVRAERQPEVSSEGYNTVPPDLAVEVEFPTSIKSQRRLEKKLAQYSGTGTTVWVVYPETREVKFTLPMDQNEYSARTIRWTAAKSCPASVYP